MRRLLLIFLMLLVPIQTTWSANHALYGHMEGKVAAGGLHMHAHDHDHANMAHHDASSPDSGVSPVDGETLTQGGESHHGCHIHPAFSMILPDRVAGLPSDAVALPPLSFSTSFTSHIPPLSDRPPAARV